MLTGLGHGAVGGSHYQDGTIHLGGAGDHVLDVVGVAGAVDMGVMALFSLVFDVSGGNGDAAGLFFRSLVDFVVGDEGTFILHSGDFRDGGSQSGFAMVNVTNGANVYVGLCAHIFFFAHDTSPWKKSVVAVL